MEEPPVEQSQPRPNEIQNLIKEYRAELARFDQGLDKRGRKARSAELKATLKGLRKALQGGPKIGSAADQAILIDLYQTQLAQWVAASASAEVDSASASDKLEAADALFSLAATPDQKALLADGVYQVIFVSRQDQQLGDGHNSTLTFAVDEALKGEVPPGGSIGVRQLSGQLPNGTSLTITAELQPKLGEKYLIFVSRGIYEQQASMNGGTASAETTYSAFSSSPYRLTGTEMLPTTIGQPRTRKGLGELRQSLKSK